jgi:hypothetical protein
MKQADRKLTSAHRRGRVLAAAAAVSLGVGSLLVPATSAVAYQDYLVAGPFSSSSACNAARQQYLHDTGYQVMSPCRAIVGDWFFEYKYK